MTDDELLQSMKEAAYDMLETGLSDWVWMNRGARAIRRRDARIAQLEATLGLIRSIRDSYHQRTTPSEAVEIVTKLDSILAGEAQ